MSNVLVVAELEDGKVRKAHVQRGRVRAKSRRAAGSFADPRRRRRRARPRQPRSPAYGASKVIAVDDAKLAHQVCELFAPTIAAVAKAGSFDVVVATASSFGKDVAPRVAAKLGAGYAPDISGVKVDGGKLVYRRPIYAGNAYGLCEITTPVKVVSVRQSEFAAAEPSGGATPGRGGARSRRPTRPRRASSSSASSTGRASAPTWARRGSSSPEGARSRRSSPRCSTRWRTSSAPPSARAARRATPATPRRSSRSGRRGASSPRSSTSPSASRGAIQHLAGMKGSKTIVAVNKDPDAPIFQVADYGLVADLFVAIPELVEELKKA